MKILPFAALLLVFSSHAAAEKCHSFGPSGWVGESNANTRFLCNEQYNAVLDLDLKIPLQVTETVKPRRILLKAESRVEARPDPRVSADKQASAADYAKLSRKGYGKVYLAASAEPQSVQAAYFSHAVPVYQGTSRQAWDEAQAFVFKLAKEGKTVRVMSGVGFDDCDNITKISGVAVPDVLWKAVLWKGGEKYFLIRNDRDARPLARSETVFARIQEHLCNIRIEQSGTNFD